MPLIYVTITPWQYCAPCAKFCFAIYWLKNSKNSIDESACVSTVNNFGFSEFLHVSAKSKRKFL